MNDKHYLLVEKYRPDSLDNFIGNEKIKNIFANYIKQKDISNLLLAGNPGIGKTSLAMLLVKQLECDYIYINASDENNIETVRTKIKNFASSLSFNGIKVIILDEADAFSISAMSALRAIIEQYSLTTRFIFTCNYANKLIPALLSRLQAFELESMSKIDVAKHCDMILNKENIKYDISDLKKIIDLYFPDIRKIINELQKNSTTGELVILKESLMTMDFKYDLLKQLFNKASIKQRFDAIRLIISEQNVKEFLPLYTFLYSQLDSFTKFTEAVMILQQHQYQDAFSIDKELCFMSCISSLLEII